MNAQVLVLNSDFSPINVTSTRRGFILVQKEKAEIVVADAENPIRSTIGDFKRPLIIRLKYFISFRRAKAKLTRYTVFARDGYVCQYKGCNETKDLTIDHVIPKSRGGRNTWINMVAACKPCNTEKDDRTPFEAKMELKMTPYEPTTTDFLVACNSTIRDAFDELMNPTSY